jgi:hypothetical protein
MTEDRGLKIEDRGQRKAKTEAKARTKTKAKAMDPH